jgi:hypothetical protein
MGPKEAGMAKRTQTRLSRPSDESGIALLVSVVILLMVTAVGFAALSRSGSEWVLGTRQRRQTATLYAADAGIELAINKVDQTVPDLTPIDQDFSDGTNIRTGTRSDGSPQSIREGGSANAPPDGYMINLGSGGFITKPFYAEITATGPDSSVVELEAKIGRLEKQ